ncbi:hypothetical protein K438DRAFT_341470 [Mycena galopus ATCC 62051]|nr:hypothetical protein K438DRAFT_341470 [Mycena galopus ATCC 62051]
MPARRHATSLIPNVRDGQRADVQVTLHKPFYGLRNRLCPSACVFCLPLRELFNLGESFDYADQLRATSDTASDDHVMSPCRSGLRIGRPAFPAQHDPFSVHHTHCTPSCLVGSLFALFMHSRTQPAQCTSLLILAPLHFALHLTPELSLPLRHVGMAIHTRTRLPSIDTLPALLFPGSLARLWRFTRVRSLSKNSHHKW